MTDPTFTRPPEGMLSEQIDLPDHNLSLGLLHIDGAGIRVCAWDGSAMRHMAPAAARRWAADLDTGPFASAFTPVVDALTNLCERVEEISAMAAARRAEKFAVGNEGAGDFNPVDVRFADMPVEGHA